MSDSLIDRLLVAVSRRRRLQAFFEGLCTGLFVGALGLLFLLVCRLVDFVPAASLGPAWSLILLGALSGGLYGLFRPLDVRDSAHRVDTRYQLKDRFLTAWQLLRRPTESSMERLQLEDTAEHALRVDVREVAPFQRPRQLVQALGTVLLAVLFSLIPPLGDHGKTSQAASVPLEVLAVIDQVDEELVEKVEELLRQNPEEKELQPLAEDLKRLAEQLEQKSSDPKETLATLSRMEARLNKAINEFNLESVDASMQEVAESLSAAEATRSAAQALKSENYSQAADELEKVNFAAMSKPERNAVAAKLKQNASAAGLRQQDKLGKLLDKLSDQLADHLDEKKAGDCQSSACELAGLCRKQGLRKGICQGLGAKLGLLSMCKSQCAGACQGNKNGGNNANLSDRPSNNWGTGSDGQPQGNQATETDGNLHREQITGIHGAGPTEIETTDSAEKSDAVTTRAYKDVYRDFQKISEAVLESEPIPLGQRQMIRTYFERIRPKDN